MLLLRQYNRLRIYFYLFLYLWRLKKIRKKVAGAPYLMFVDWVVHMFGFHTNKEHRPGINEHGVLKKFSFYKLFVACLCICKPFV